MESAATRGVRLGGDVTLHVQSCRACARAHRAIRRRRRVAALLPIGFLIRTAGVRDRLRDLVAFNPAWEAQVGAAKMCTAACLSIGAAGAAAPAVTVVTPIIAKATATPSATAPVAHKRTRHRAKPTPDADATPSQAGHHAAADAGVDRDARAGRAGQADRPTAARFQAAVGGGTGGGMSEDEAPKAAVRGRPTPVVTPVPTTAAG